MLSLFATLLFVSAATATDFTKCDSGLPPKSLSVAGCAKQPCDFKPGSHLSVDINFAVDHTVTKLTPDVKASVLGLTTDYPLPQPDGCKALVNSKCPLESDETATYNLEMNIPPIKIKSSVELLFTMTDQTSKILCCFKIKGTVV